MGYEVELLRGPWTCFDGSLYAALIVFDPEEELWDQEILKLERSLASMWHSCFFF